jgi:hypothetical protein
VATLQARRRVIKLEVIGVIVQTLRSTDSVKVTARTIPHAQGAQQDGNLIRNKNVLFHNITLSFMEERLDTSIIFVLAYVDSVKCISFTSINYLILEI